MDLACQQEEEKQKVKCLKPFQPHESQRRSSFGPLCSMHFLLRLQNLLEGLEPSWVGIINCLDFLVVKTIHFKVLENQQVILA